MRATRVLPLLALVIAGCSVASGQGRRDGVEQGRALLAAGKPRAARVALLNAIKADPNDARARLLQAETYLALNDGRAAQGELDQALALGTPEADIAHLRAHARLLLGDAAGALALLDAAPSIHAAYAARIRGRALALQGNEADATLAFDEARTIAPDDPALWIDLARFRRDAGDIGGAIEASRKAAALAPNSAEAVTLRGELVRTQYGLAAALPWFDRALALDPTDVTAMTERAATLAELGRYRDMLAQTRTLLAVAPETPMAYYLQAVLAARARAFPLARGLMARTGGALDTLPAAMLLQGALAFQSGDLKGAVARLSPLVERQPGNLKARRLLAAAQFAAADYAGVAATLQPIAARGDADSYALNLLGRAALRSGDEAGGADYLARAAVAMREPTPIGDEGAPPEVAAVRAMLAAGYVGEAVARARSVAAGNPGVPAAQLLLGDALLAAGDPRGAAEAYRAAANLAFTEAAALRLVEALGQAGEPAAADAVLQLFLQQNPRSIAARLLAAERHMAAREWEAAIDAYEAVRARTGDRDAALLAALALAYYRDGVPQAAVPLARKAWSLDPANPVAAEIYGWLLVRSGRDVAAGMSLMQRTWLARRA